MSYTKIMLEIFILMTYIAVGYIIRKIRLISETGIHDISRLIVNVAYPLLIISSMNVEYETEHVRNILYIFVSAFMFLTFTSLSSKQIIKILGGESGQKKSMRYCMIFGNVAFLGYPICYAFFGEIGMFYASIYVVTQNLFQWTLGVNIFKQEKIRLSNLKKLMNPGIIAITIGLSMFFFNIRTPMIMERIIKGIGGTAVPLALMMIGATLQQYKFSEIASDKRIYIIAALKTLVFPVIFLSILYFIPMNRMLKSILTIQAAAPVQATSVVFAKNFNGDSVVPAKVVFLSVILCLVTVPLFLVLINI